MLQCSCKKGKELSLFGAKHGQNNLSKTFDDDDDAEEVNRQKSRTHQMIDTSKKPNTFLNDWISYKNH